MAWTDVRPFFNNILEAKGFHVWPDGFDITNIPTNVLERAYHVSIGTVTGGPSNQRDQLSSMSIQVQFFIKGYRDPSSAIDQAIGEAEEIVKEVIRPSQRTATAGIGNIVFASVDFNRLNDSNDNAILAIMGFEAKIYFCTDR